MDMLTQQMINHSDTHQQMVEQHLRAQRQTSGSKSSLSTTDKEDFEDKYVEIKSYIQRVREEIERVR